MPNCQVGDGAGASGHKAGDRHAADAQRILTEQIVEIPARPQQTQQQKIMDVWFFLNISKHSDIVFIREM